MYKNQTISVIMPCRNEGGHLATIIKKIPKWVDEIIVVSNKSTDNTVEVARNLGLTVYEDNRTIGGIGYGFAHMTGIKNAKGDIIVGIDGDGTYPIETLDEILNYMQKSGKEFLSCNRYPLKDGTKIPLKLRVGVQSLNVETKILYGATIKDILSGMWVFKKELRPQLGLTMGDWNLSPQIKINAATNQDIDFGEYHIVQHVREGETKQNYFKTGFSHAVWIFKNRLETSLLKPLTEPYVYRFLIVGSVAFIFNYCLLTFIHSVTGLGKFPSEALSMLVAVQLTFFMHDRWTYAESNSKRRYFLGIGKRYVSYIASNAFSAALTVVLFGLLVQFMPNLLALGVAGVVSMAWNFIINKLFIWRHPAKKSTQEEAEQES